ncbi:hypothetical protein PLICRDRAFT_38622 [Plicaturopsis crispa FD-325 SS-3]|nr:hypothetical protein PLICRDRAFT_38622 [Plicaturopsis crispa FD-325 SS-3]
MNKPKNFATSSASTSSASVSTVSRTRGSSNPSTPRRDSTSTLVYAGPVSVASGVQKSNPLARPLHPQPHNHTEQYWAARAMTAETLLLARTTHQREMQLMSYAADSKLSRERALLALANQKMHRRLEKIVAALLATILFLVAALVYTLVRSHRSNASRSSWFHPPHFTIPILSPFTSVVEHESSVIGTKTISVAIVVLACLVYALGRHKIASMRLTPG